MPVIPLIRDTYARDNLIRDTYACDTWISGPPSP